MRSQWRVTIRRLEDGEAVKRVYDSHAIDPLDALADALMLYEGRGQDRKRIGEIRLIAVHRDQ